MTDRPDATRTPVSGGPDAAWTDLATAAARLGISPDAARKRLERGTLRGEKRTGRWLVWLPDPDATGRRLDAAPDAGPDATWTPPDATAPDHLADLRAEVAYLREQLDHSRRELAAERERFDVIHREALERIPALGAGEASSPATPSAPARPWWRRWLGVGGRG